MGSSPDPFRAGAYNLQLISTLRPNGLVYKTKEVLAMTNITAEQNKVYTELVQKFDEYFKDL